jgi:hypothetical protein
MKLRISVTKEILEESKWCGFGSGENEPINKNCAISLAVRDIWPDAIVENAFMVAYPEWGINYCIADSKDKIKLPQIARSFICDFDGSEPCERTQIPPISFEVDVADEVINRINIDEIKELLKDHSTLQLC